ncbi:MAG: peptide chain release factor 2 [Proteobacteria bacterium]|nr:peptide chain release factor 2 [Pseudomonadota bacterium]
MIEQQLSENIKKYSKVVENLYAFLVNSKIESKLHKLEVESNLPELWENPEKARDILQNKATMEKTISSIKKACEQFETAVELLELADAEDNKSDIAEYTAVLESSFAEIDKIETRRLLSGKTDMNNAFLEINSGAGGTESQDWANMLLRMYTRWAENENFKVDLVEYNAGEGAGIKSATIMIKGDYAFGLSRTEIGVHRLVRISPFDSQNRRHTSFASVFVYPEVNNDIDIQVSPEDLKIDTYRASGAGGQHVNTTDSAVRITHTPSKIVVQCQNQRSQHKNKDEAMKMLKAKLYEMEITKQKDEQQSIADSKTDNSWGHQIRSYVLHPYKLIKDLRTNVESSNIDSILNGDLNPFIQAELNRKNQG